jgi:hypothetical protein
MATKTQTSDGRPVDVDTGEILDPKPGGIAEPTSLVAEALAIFNEEWQGLTLAGKIARITGHVGTIEKRGYNAFHKYNYVTEADLVGAVRQYLAAAGIIIVPDVIKTRLLRENTENPITEVIIEYTVTDGTNSFTFKMPGHGADKGDKGVYKAITGSQKYALMKLFKIETGDDPERDTKVDERSAASGGVRRQVNITSGLGGTTKVRPGAHTETANVTQLRRVKELMLALDWTREDLVEAIGGLLVGEPGAPPALVLPDEEEAQGAAIAAYLEALPSNWIGKLIAHMDAARTSQEAAEGSPYG